MEILQAAGPCIIRRVGAITMDATNQPFKPEGYIGLHYLLLNLVVVEINAISDDHVAFVDAPGILPS